MSHQTSFWFFILWIFSTIFTICAANDPITAMAQCSNTAQNVNDHEFWMDKFNSLGMRDYFSEEKIGMKFICKLNNLQHLLEHDGTTHKHQIGPMECIQQNDPALYQVVIGLIDTVIKAKRAIMEKEPYDLLPLISQLQLSAIFLAKRSKISWQEIIPLNGINEDGIFRESMTLLDEQKCDNQNEWSNSHNGRGKQNRQKSYEKSILQLTLTAIEDAEKIMQKLASKKQKRRRRRRRGKRAGNGTNPFVNYTNPVVNYTNPFVNYTDPYYTGTNNNGTDELINGRTKAEWHQIQVGQITALAIYFVLAILIVGIFLCVRRCHQRRQMAAAGQAIAGAQQPIVNAQRLRASQQLNPRMGPKFVEEFNKFPIKYVGAEERECSVCLSNIEPRTQVRPMLACKHVFHGSCIEAWLLSGHTLCPLCRVPIFIISGETVRPNEQNVAGSYENGVVPQIELTILGENQNEQPSTVAAGSNNNH